MYYIRPITIEDLDTLHSIALQSGPGFTSLPDNLELLKEKIQHSDDALRQETLHPQGESYLFVLVNDDTNQVVGTTGIEASVGLKEPWYHYRIGTVVHASRELKVHNRFKTLYLCNDYTGCSEVCTLYLSPEHRHSNNGSLLSKSRFLFMAEHPQRFAHRVIAEMRGYSDDRGQSPFWEGLGRKFFSMEYSEADYLTGSGNKVFIAELMPKHSIYIHLLPEEAQAVIGRVHANTEPAKRMLEQEGFRFENYVDIFDAGPTITAPLQQIRAVRESRYAQVVISSAIAEEHPRNHLLISNTQQTNFRCALAYVQETAGTVHISAKLADILQVKNNNQVRLVELKGARS